MITNHPKRQKVNDKRAKGEDNIIYFEDLGRDLTSSSP